MKVFIFPPNVTALYQPLDQGIIAALKTGYKSRLLEKLVEVVGNFEQLQVLASQLPAGCAGLCYACPPHVAWGCLLVAKRCLGQPLPISHCRLLGSFTLPWCS